MIDTRIGVFKWHDLNLLKVESKAIVGVNV